jgi:hypothetical protein
MADKLAIALTPSWLYLLMVRASGEIHEYMAHAKHRIIGEDQEPGLKKLLKCGRNRHRRNWLKAS